MFCPVAHYTEFTNAFFKCVIALQGWDVPQSRSVRFREEIKLLLLPGIDYDSPDWALYRAVLYPQRCAAASQCAGHETVIGDIFVLFWSYSLWLHMYVCLLQVNARNEWESLVDHFCLPKHCANCGVGLKQIYLRSDFPRITIEKPKHVLSVDCTLDSDSQLRQREVRNSHRMYLYNGDSPLKLLAWYYASVCMLSSNSVSKLCPWLVLFVMDQSVLDGQGIGGNRYCIPYGIHTGCRGDPISCPLDTSGSFF